LPGGFLPARASVCLERSPRPENSAHRSIYAYRELVQEIATQLETRIRLVPVPFAMWSMLATAAEFLPAVSLTRNQVDLMRRDNVAAVDLPGLEELGIQSRGIEDVIRMHET